MYDNEGRRKLRPRLTSSSRADRETWWSELAIEVVTTSEKRRLEV